MEKDFFNGKVKDADIKYAKYSLIFVPIITILLSLMLLFMALFLPLKTDAKIATFIIVAIGFICGIAYPFITVSLIRKYPKYKKLTKLFISESIFKDDII